MDYRDGRLFFTEDERALTNLPETLEAEYAQDALAVAEALRGQWAQIRLTRLGRFESAPVGYKGEPKARLDEAERTYSLVTRLYTEIHQVVY